jgi:demethylmenaquinone methyltransferase/2-methoxy-6-polyprenyl-1,4-benzoquinol methylase
MPEIDREIVLTFPNGGGMRMDGTTFVTGFAVPNFYFHATTTYAILRAQGVEIGKAGLSDAPRPAHVHRRPLREWCGQAGGDWRTRQTEAFTGTRAALVAKARAMSDTVSFGYEEVSPEEKTERVGAVFSSVAKNYDVMNDAMSGGMHRLWKDKFVRRVKPRRASRSSTWRAALATSRSGWLPGATITVSDINQDMLDVGIERAMDKGLDDLVWSRQNAETLTFPDRFFDAYTIAFGIRNVTRIDKAWPRPTACSSMAGGSSASNSRPPNGRASRKPMTSIRTSWCPGSVKAIAGDAGQLSLSDRIDPPLPADARIREHDPHRRVREHPGRTDPGRTGGDPFRLENLTQRDSPKHSYSAAAALGPDPGPARRAARDRGMIPTPRRRSAG